jgi:hypothetical protein
LLPFPLRNNISLSSLVSLVSRLSLSLRLIRSFGFRICVLQRERILFIMKELCRRQRNRVRERDAR